MKTYYKNITFGAMFILTTLESERLNNTYEIYYPTENTFSFHTKVPFKQILKAFIQLWSCSIIVSYEELYLYISSTLLTVCPL